jgi:hypothetical protein
VNGALSVLRMIVMIIDKIKVPNPGSEMKKMRKHPLRFHRTDRTGSGHASDAD